MILCDHFSDERFEAYMADLLETVSDMRSFILGVGDNIMPESRFDRILRIGEMVAEHP